MDQEQHSILDGRCHVYRRVEGGKWQCSTFLEGRNHRVSTGETSLKAAKEFAEDWYLTLRGKQKTGTLIVSTGPTFREIAARWEQEYDAMTGGTRNRTYVEGNGRRLKKYLNPFFGDLPITDVSTAKVHEYRHLRMTPGEDGNAPARGTLHQEMVTLRQVLKAGMRYGVLAHLPDLSEPYTTGHKVSHRAWFSHPEYKLFTTAIRDRVKDLQKTRHRKSAEDFRDYVLIMANTGLRPDEANRLQYQDVEIALDPETEETILIISVRGKRGVGYCKSTANAVFPFERMVERNQPQPTDLMFPGHHYVLMQRILDKTKLRFDREGNPRSAYSLRHTYISMRLEEGADIYQIAKNCRTSVEMIEKHYASHIRTSISAKAVNVRAKPLPKRKQEEMDRRNAHRFGKSVETAETDT
jgi:integrase